MNYIVKIMLAIIAVTYGSVVLAVPPDFSTLVAAVDFSTVITAIMSIFVAVAGVYIVMRGGALVLSKVRR